MDRVNGHKQETPELGEGINVMCAGREESGERGPVVSHTRRVDGCDSLQEAARLLE